ncbi:hypothetical protein IE81DRAFT_321722 [Ceraceosorus guamensis]|uniref:Methylase n=1 Tax=Ceraceosorus guamensis TaxID=1522189 RepID=A0A316W3H2_9BASI|nr:hypothetical protein IE81DRAFT_321722 [Ceraceosorus guamensis]PWN44064.1 hypothetical protein IE81DRAFT_321722 [Ceraceosorus guamensis]
MATPTPELPLSKADYRHVYEPAEDTFALLDALDADADRLRSLNGGAGMLCVEIGSGSGCVSAFLAALLGATNAAFLTLDVNDKANVATGRTGTANGVHLSPIRSDMLSALFSRCSSRSESATSGLVDILLFNPPYVPTTEAEEAAAQADQAIAGAWAGGSMGTRLVDQLIEQGIETVLAPRGIFYLVAIRANDPPALIRRLEARGLSAEIALQRRAGGEHLFIIRAQRK